jgi:hypothetical protein
MKRVPVEFHEEETKDINNEVKNKCVIQIIQIFHV